MSRASPHTIDPASRHAILEYESNGHNGGDLAFGPDGCLYISAGDGTSDSDTDLTGQNLADLPSAILRLDIPPAGSIAAIRFRQTTPLSTRPAHGVRSGPTVCAIPGGYHSTVTAACGSATLGRTGAR